MAVGILVTMLPGLVVATVARVAGRQLVVFAVIFMVVGAVLVVAFLESATGPSRRVLGLVVGVLVGFRPVITLLVLAVWTRSGREIGEPPHAVSV